MNLIRKFNPSQLYIDGVLGSYMLSVFTINGNTTGEIFQFRWTASPAIAAIRKITITDIPVTATQTAFGSPNQIDLIRATSWTGQGTGGVAIDLSGGSCKRRTSMATSQVAAGDIRHGITLGVGTKTLEANSLANVISSPAANPLLPAWRMLEVRPGDTEYPLVLQQNEGFVLKIIQANPAGGQEFGICVEWDEVSSS